MDVPDLASVTAVILAGGLGTRLRSVVSDRPKALAEVKGRPFLAYLLDQVATAGVRTVVLCTGFLGGQVRAMFGDSYGSLRLTYSQEDSPLGTAGALRLALPRIRSNVGLVMNGDSYCQADLKAFWAFHQASGADATMYLVEMPDTGRYGQVQVGEGGRILRFDEKGRQTGPGWINAGIYLISRRLLLTIPENRAASIEREMFPTWIGQGLYGYRGQGRFLDIGTPESYAAAAQFFAF